jgi:hypothetical protein
MIAEVDADGKVIKPGGWLCHLDASPMLCSTAEHAHLTALGAQVERSQRTVVRKVQIVEADGEIWLRPVVDAAPIAGHPRIEERWEEIGHRYILNIYEKPMVESALRMAKRTGNIEAARQWIEMAMIGDQQKMLGAFAELAPVYLKAR